MKVLNLYSGIGGNRKLWEGVEVTAVELNPEIANIYSDFFPKDKIVIGDAHEYLLEHFEEYDFIWSSPPCPTHSRFNHLNRVQGKKIRYPDMKLYEEIIILKKWYRGYFCIENVITYYEPLIKPIKSGSHYYWTNFYFTPLKNNTRHIRANDSKNTYLAKKFGIDLSEYKLNKVFKRTIVNNCVDPKHGLHILSELRGIPSPLKSVQQSIFNN